jgi:hypothetical protein
MSRPAASDVSALSGSVANGRQAVHHVSSPPSKIPYGGFSPVRLQTGLRPQPSLPAHTGGLYVALPRVAPGPGSPSVWAKGQVGTRHPVQRPLARRRVVLSRQVMAYYGLIRGSGPIPPVFFVGIRRVFARGPGPRASLLLSARPSCRAAFLTPAAGWWMTVPHPSVVAFAQFAEARRSQHPRKSRFTRGFSFGAAKFALCCGPAGCSSYTDKDFYSQACAPSGRPWGRRV